MKLKLIGLSGPAGSGKDTVGEIIKEFIPAQKIAFGDSIRQIIKVLNPILSSWEDCPITYVDYLETVGYDNAKQLPEVRRLFQTMGTEVGRELISPNLWINQVDKKISQEKDGIFYIPDVRFMNEAEYITKYSDYNPDYFGVVIKIIGRKAILPDNLANHKSEKEMTHLPYDFVINNNGSISELRDSVESILVNILGEDTWNW